MIFTFYCAHYIGCMFFFIAFVKYSQNEGKSCGQKANWATESGFRFYAEADECIDGHSVFSPGNAYVTAIYWATATLTTVGYGDISASLNNHNEIVFAIFALISGTIIYTVIIGNLEDIVSQLDITSSLFKKKLDSIKTYANQQVSECQ